MRKRRIVPFFVFSPFRGDKDSAERKSKRRLRDLPRCRLSWAEASASRAQRKQAKLADLPRRRLLSLSVARMFREADALLIGSKRGAADRSEDGIMPGAHSPARRRSTSRFRAPAGRGCVRSRVPFCRSRYCRFHLFVCFSGCVRKRRIVPFFVFSPFRGDKDSASRAQKQAKIGWIAGGAALSWAEANASRSAKQAKLADLPRRRLLLVIGCRNVRGGRCPVDWIKRGAADRSEDGLCPVAHGSPARRRSTSRFRAPLGEDAFDLASHFAVADNCRFHLFVCFEVCAKTPDCSVLRFSPFRGDKGWAVQPSAQKRSEDCGFAEGCRLSWAEAKEVRKPSAKQAKRCGFAEALFSSVIGCKNVPGGRCLLNWIEAKVRPIVRRKTGLCPVRIVPLAEDRRADFVPPAGRGCVRSRVPFAVADNCRFHLFVCFSRCVRNAGLFRSSFFAVQGDKDSASRAQKQAKIADLPSAALSWAEAKVQAERKSKAKLADLPRRRLLSLSVEECSGRPMPC